MLAPYPGSNPSAQLTDAQPTVRQGAPTAMPETSPTAMGQAITTAAIKNPTLAAFMNHQVGQGMSGATFSEEKDPTLENAMDKVSPVKSLLNSMHSMPPQRRAEVGSKVGAAIGLQARGNIGAIIGAAAGGYAGRALGLHQSGEHEDNTRLDRMHNTIRNMGIANKQGHIELENESLPLLYPKDARLPNVSSQILGGQSDRPHYEVDKSNPLSKRTMTAVRPLARYIGSGLLKYGSDKNPRDVTAVDRLTAMFVNSLQHNANDITHVYDRAKGLGEKIGVAPEAVKNYVKSLKGTVSEKEFADLQKGLEILYA